MSKHPVALWHRVRIILLLAFLVAPLPMAQGGALDEAGLAKITVHGPRHVAGGATPVFEGRYTIGFMPASYTLVHLEVDGVAVAHGYTNFWGQYRIALPAPDAAGPHEVHAVRHPDRLDEVRSERFEMWVVRVPPAVTNLDVSPGAVSGEMQVTWTPPAEDPIRPVLGYRVYRAPLGGDWELRADLERNATSYPDRVEHEHTYTYLVAPRNPAGENRTGSQVTVTTPPPAPADAIDVRVTHFTVCYLNRYHQVECVDAQPGDSVHAGIRAGLVTFDAHLEGSLTHEGTPVRAWLGGTAHASVRTSECWTPCDRYAAEWEAVTDENGTYAVTLGPIGDTAPYTGEGCRRMDLSVAVAYESLGDTDAAHVYYC